MSAVRPGIYKCKLILLLSRSWRVGNTDFLRGSHWEDRRLLSRSWRAGVTDFQRSHREKLKLLSGSCSSQEKPRGGLENCYLESDVFVTLISQEETTERKRRLLSGSWRVHHADFQRGNHREERKTVVWIVRWSCSFPRRKPLRGK